MFHRRDSRCLRLPPSRLGIIEASIASALAAPSVRKFPNKFDFVLFLRTSAMQKSLFIAFGLSSFGISLAYSYL